MSTRSIVAQLAGLPPLSLLGQPVTGVELAMIVAINPELPYAEAMRTPQVIAELGRCTAAALRAKEDAELEYRIWRDTLVHRLTNDVEAAKLAGFDCAVNPGVDAKNNPKEPKTPSLGAVEVYLRTLPEYSTHYAQQHAATETWAAFHAAFEAAKSRQWAVRMKEESGGNVAGEVEVERPGPAWDPNPPVTPPSMYPPPAQATIAPPPPPPVGPVPPPPPVRAPAPPAPPTIPPPPLINVGDNGPPASFLPPFNTPPVPPIATSKRPKPPPPPPPR